jgi:hypothetical protein
MTGQTNWSPYNVPALAGILNDDFSGAWEQVGAWFSAQSMLDDASSKLQDARDGLAAVWPPESSPAATTFFEVVDNLADSMKATALASNTNGNALYQVLTNQDATKTRVDALHSTWALYQKLTPANPTDFPDPSDWQSGLNVQAQQHMAAADNVINEYAATLTVPPVLAVPGGYEPLAVIPGTDAAAEGTRAPGGTSPDLSRPAGSISTSSKTGPSVRRVTPILTTTGDTPAIGVSPTSRVAGSLGTTPQSGFPVTLRPGPSGNGNPEPDRPQVSPRSDVPRASAPGNVLDRPTLRDVAESQGNALSASADDATGINGRTSESAGFGFVGGAPARDGGVNGPPRLRTSSAPTFGAAGEGTPTRSVTPLDPNGTIRPGAPFSITAGNGRAFAADVPASGTGAAPPLLASLGTAGSVGQRRTMSQATWPMPVGGPSILVPDAIPVFHDPGPGVIGIDL